MIKYVSPNKRYYNKKKKNLSSAHSRRDNTHFRPNVILTSFYPEVAKSHFLLPWILKMWLLKPGLITACNRRPGEQIVRPFWVQWSSAKCEYMYSHSNVCLLTRPVSSKDASRVSYGILGMWSRWGRAPDVS